MDRSQRIRDYFANVSHEDFIAGLKRAGFEFIMTPDEFEARMKEAAEEDGETGHRLADELMAKLLTSLGYGKGVEVFEKMGKWYA